MSGVVQVRPDRACTRQAPVAETLVSVEQPAGIKAQSLAAGGPLFEVLVAQQIL